jgi:oligoendopeptidase F
MEEFKKMSEIVETFFTSTKSLMSYCDYIAHLIQSTLKIEDTNEEKLLASVGRTKMDLSESGSFMSTKKTIDVEDRFGKKYRITVEEIK